METGKTEFNFVITKNQLIKLGFEQDGESDRFELWTSNAHIELSGTDSIGNHDPLPEGHYKLTADLGYIHLSRAFTSINDIQRLIDLIG